MTSGPPTEPRLIEATVVRSLNGRCAPENWGKQNRLMGGFVVYRPSWCVNLKQKGEHTMKKKYQQGDVLLVSVTKQLELYIKSKLLLPDYPGIRGWDENGKIILALGEATGHHHRFELNKLDPGVTVSAFHNRYTIVPTCFIIEGGNATLYHEEHNPISVPPGFYRRTIVREFDHISGSFREVVD